MSRSIVILSSMVDTTIKESLPMDRVLTFHSIQELMDYTESTPVRAETMYITREVLNPSVNTSLAILMSMLSNPFLVVDEIVYVTESGSKELPSISFMLEENKNLNWVNQVGSLTREYVTGLIAGTLRSEDYKPRRMSVYRQKKDEYIKSRIKNEDLQAKYPVDEEELADIPDEEVTPVVFLDTKSVCKAVTVSGLPEKERTVFAFLLAQYLSTRGKTLIVERDYDYLTLTDMMARTDLPYRIVNVSDIFFNADQCLRVIRTCPEQLILVTEKERESHDYSFMCNFLYNNLAEHLSSMVTEKELDEIAPTTSFTVVVPNNVVDVLRTVERLPPFSIDNVKFAMVNMKKISGYGIPNTAQARILLSDLLQCDISEILHLNIKSLKLGGEAHDLRMFT